MSWQFIQGAIATIPSSGSENKTTKKDESMSLFEFGQKLMNKQI